MAKLQKIYRLRELQNFTGIRRTVLLDMVKAGKFPKPVKLNDGGRAIGWLEEELIAWQQKIAGKAAKAAEQETKRQRELREAREAAEREEKERNDLIAREKVAILEREILHAALDEYIRNKPCDVASSLRGKVGALLEQSRRQLRELQSKTINL
jgi:prophage regulatory protein